MISVIALEAYPRLFISLQTILRQPFAVEVTASCLGHHVKQSLIEAEVVPTMRKEIVTGER